MTDRIVLADMKNAGFCIPGVEKFVEASGMDFRDFARNGIPVEKALEMDGWQAFVAHVLKIKGNQRG